jgi:large subunit ribosomal protein L18
MNQKRKNKIRNKVFGTPTRPRLSVFKSNKEIYAQLIDDINSITLASYTSKQNKFNIYGTKYEEAIFVGKKLGEKALKKGIKK